ncbi:hypothetical protein ACLMJK_003944, partial [Lecanora helva]
APVSRTQKDVQTSAEKTNISSLLQDDLSSSPLEANSTTGLGSDNSSLSSDPGQSGNHLLNNPARLEQLKGFVFKGQGHLNKDTFRKLQENPHLARLLLEYQLASNSSEPAWNLSSPATTGL